MTAQVTYHRHRSSTQRIVAYTGGVGVSGTGPHRQEPRAAGGICTVDYCACGAYRKTNQNNGYSERGPWIEVAS